MTYVKVCGLRETTHVMAAVEAGADAVGFVLTPSPRQVSPDEVRRLCGLVPPHVLTVAVFAEAMVDAIRAAAREAGVRAIQLHGDYPAEAFAALDDLGLTLVRAVSALHASDLSCGAHGEDLLIVDGARPGSGEPWDWSGLPSHPSGRWMLAGGLNPDNLPTALAALRPWGVDVSSGVEITRGVKDTALIHRFVTTAREFDPVL